MPPTTKDVLPGASVNIILKADQRTGRTVSGTIADVLTRGNHPRGIKVRLTDGRVGRVQSMKGGSGAPTTSTTTTTATTAGPLYEGSGSRSAPGMPSQHVGLDA
ncbi:hypothetical protein BBP40_006896, partial [Aspergillus hancockii]